MAALAVPGLASLGEPPREALEGQQGAGGQGPWSQSRLLLSQGENDTSQNML